MSTTGRSAALVALMSLMGVLSSCGGEAVPREASLEGATVRRAILTCDLPASPSIVAFVSVGPDRYIMTPASDGETASLTLTLGTGDTVVVEILYSVDGELVLIASARASVPASGPLELNEADFVLADADENGVADCHELPTEDARSVTQAVSRADERAHSDAADWARLAPPVPVAPGAGTKPASISYEGADGHAMCARDNGGHGRWYWQIRLDPQMMGPSGATRVVAFDLKLVGRIDPSSPETVVVLDRRGERTITRAGYSPGVDWTRFRLALAALAEGASRASSSEGVFAPEARLHVLGYYSSGPESGSCIANLAIESNGISRSLW